MSDATPAGYYHAKGDPPDTVRHWDGTRWTGEPTRVPAGAESTHAAAPADPSRYGGVGIRIGATLIDSAIVLATVLIFDLLVMLLVIWAIYLFMAAWQGGTPGKLIVGLRITTEDGMTTPPGLRRALVRQLPTLVAVVPGIGGILNLGLLILCVVFVAQDDERRSVFDRVGATRVVRKTHLS